MRVGRFFLLLTTLFLNALVSKAWELNLSDRGIIHVQDTAQNEVVYVHISIDPKKNNARKVTYEMLTVGNRIRNYGGYDDYQLDSIYMAQPDLELNHEEYVNFTKPYEQTYVSVSIDPANDLLTYYGRIFINSYRYTEPIPEIDWQLSEETQEVMGYECHKATARWRGRDWTAWYSTYPSTQVPGNSRDSREVNILIAVWLFEWVLLILQSVNINHNAKYGRGREKRRSE